MGRAHRRHAVHRRRRPPRPAGLGRLVTADDLARRLYHSLHDQLLTLPDATYVFPAHGAGSACGKYLSTDDRRRTIGEQRRTNYALAPMSEDDFVEAVTRASRWRRCTSRSPPTPTARSTGAARRGGTPSPSSTSTQVAGTAPRGRGRRRRPCCRGVRRRSPPRLGQRRPRRPLRRVRRRRGATRTAGRPGHRPGPGTRRRKVRLARIGFDTVVGTLPDVEAVLAEHPELAEAPRPVPGHRGSPLAGRDRRRPGRRRAQPGRARAGRGPRRGRPSRSRGLLDRLADLDPHRPTLVYCAGGYRSSIAASLLRCARLRARSPTSSAATAPGSRPGCRSRRAPGTSTN